MKDDLHPRTVTSEAEDAPRDGLASALARLLDTPLGGVGTLDVLAEAVTACAPELRAAFFSAQDEGWTPLAGSGAAPEPVPREPAESALQRGTGAVERVLLLGGEGERLGWAVFSTEREAGLGVEHRLLARVASERAARVLERAALRAELTRAEEAARRTAAFRDQILAIVGHDLRNPLGAVVMSAALLQKKGALSGWQAKTVDRVRASSARMSRIIDDLLSYTRTRLGTGIPIAARQADLRDVTRKVVEELAAAHPSSLIQVSAEGDFSGEWDPDRLEQVVSNLVSNAIDHGEEGHPVEVSLRWLADVVVVDVVNRGEMPQQVIDHAFEAFHRGPEQTGRKASGLGLGLYIAREIVRRHGGDIAVRSEDGSTSIALSLPRRCAPPAAPSPPPADP